MIKVRIADFPGMRPGNHNVDIIVVLDYRGNVKQVIKSDNVDIEASFEVRRQRKVLLFLEHRKPSSTVLVGEPVVTGRDLAMMLLGGVATFGCLVLAAFV